MLRNSLVSLGIHILILIMSGILYFSNGHSAFLGFVVLLSFAGYIALGNVLLKPRATVAANLLSVSLVSLIGLSIGLFCWFNPSQMGYNWMLFLFYNLYSLALVQIFQFPPDPAHTFWFFILPTLLQWIGLQTRKR